MDTKASEGDGLVREETRDRRIRKTKAHVQNALPRLLMQRDLKDISVSEIPDMADINRGTFYLHLDYMAAMAERLVRNCGGNKDPIENRTNLH